jgi:hypothetical protein
LKNQNKQSQWLPPPPQTNLPPPLATSAAMAPTGPPACATSPISPCLIHQPPPQLSNRSLELLLAIISGPHLGSGSSIPAAMDPTARPVLAIKIPLELLHLEAEAAVTI